MVIDDANINLNGLIFILVMGLLTLVFPRRFALLPLIASSCLMTLGQQVVVAGLHFSALRIMILFGWMRILSRRELTSIKFTIIDKLIIIYSCVCIVTNILLWGTYEALKGQSGYTYDLIGIYFLCRSVISSSEDIERAIKIIGLFLIPLAGFMIFEQLTGRNIFSIFGGVPEVAVLRDTHFRCQGPFRHPVLAGTFGATSFPLLVGLWRNPENRKFWVIMFIIASTVVTFISVSSGPIMAYGFGLIGLIAWVWRRHMRTIRWGILFALIGLHLIMKAPVWYLISRISDVIGGSGWHRSFLIEQAIRHINEWWLIGTKYTAHWMPYALAINPDMADITNQFIGEGVSGGLVKMILFIAIIVAGFKMVGQSIQIGENTPRFSPFQAWSMGACLVAHVASFFSVGYFDQMIVFWYLLLAFTAPLGTDHGASSKVGDYAVHR